MNACQRIREAALDALTQGRAAPAEEQIERFRLAGAQPLHQCFVGRRAHDPLLLPYP